MRKLRTIEMNRLTLEEFKEAEKLSLIVVLDDVRSLYNVGSVFRSCDAFRVEAVYLCESKISRAISVFHCDTFGSLVHVSLYDMTIQTAVHHHRTLYVHLVAHLEQTQITAVQGFLHGGNGIGAVFYFHYGEADAVVRHALVYSEFINKRTFQRKGTSCHESCSPGSGDSSPLHTVASWHRTRTMESWC